MVSRREHEAEAELVDRLRDPFSGQVELEAEGLEHVRRAGLRRDGAVPVLRDTRAGGRGHECRSGRDVEGLAAVAAGAGRVDQVAPLRVDRDDVLAHRLRATGDLVCGLALQPEGDEEAADLPGRRLAAHDLVHDRVRLHAVQRVAVEEFHVDSSRKLLTSSRPQGVSTDSGWNWTPSIGNFVCRTAITSPSGARADTSSESGSRVAASE